MRKASSRSYGRHSFKSGSELTQGRIQGIGSSQPSRRSARMERVLEKGKQVRLTVGQSIARKGIMMKRIASSAAQKSDSRRPARKFQMVDELSEFKHLRGRERYVAFFEKYDREEVDNVDMLMNFGGMTEKELWNFVQVKYKVNQRLRLWEALKICEPHKNPDLLLQRHPGQEEELIEQKTKLAKEHMEQMEAHDASQTWKSGAKNTFQMLPQMELGD